MPRYSCRLCQTTVLPILISWFHFSPFYHTQHVGPKQGSRITFTVRVRIDFRTKSTHVGLWSGKDSYRWQGFNIYTGPSHNACITNLEGPCSLIKAAINVRFVPFSLLALGQAGPSKSHFRRGGFFSHQLTSGTCVLLQLSAKGNLVHKSIQYDTSRGT